MGGRGGKAGRARQNTLLPEMCLLSSLWVLWSGSSFLLHLKVLRGFGGERSCKCALRTLGSLINIAPKLTVSLSGKDGRVMGEGVVSGKTLFFALLTFLCLVPGALPEPG